MVIGSTLELWGGIECTINRVGDHFYDQIRKSGHDQRQNDIGVLSSLGIRAMRYPVLWEQHCSSCRDIPDCSAARQRIDQLFERGIQPIVGLLHHGSGPADISLMAPDFPARFADYALSIAKQLPDVRCFTPINEPLTTARFCGLYGHWYPHRCDDKSFLLALFNQVEATQLAMQAIRSVSSEATLVQTENLDHCHSTSPLQYQADFENSRRWLSIDLLTGRVDGHHPLWSYMEQCADDMRLTERLRLEPVDIDILGWNYYLTSERFLDHRLDRYPSNTFGGNGRDRYADVEAVRVMTDGLQGLEGLFLQAWSRYELPTAITEVHLGCHRESQMRWILDAWQAALRLRNAGVDLRALTVWNLLGSWDWDSLCTLSRSHYESGVFDTRSGQLRPTSLVGLLQSLSNALVFEHPALPAHGWWELPDRFIFGSYEADVPESDEIIDNQTRSICDIQVREHEVTIAVDRPPLLITGANGTLGNAFGEICRQRRIPHCLVTRSELDITDQPSIESAIQRYQPWAIINTAGYVCVDDAERQREECLHSNTYAAHLLAIASTKYDIPLLTYSTDLVFDGKQRHPYVENDAVSALNVYGQSKVLAEQMVLGCAPRSLVVRTSSFFGLWDDHNFLTSSLQRLERGHQVHAVNDWIVSPTYVPHLVHTSLDLLIDGVQGVWHLVNEGQVTWHAFLCEAASHLGFETHNIIGRRRSESQFVALRPAYSALASTRGMLLPRLSESIETYCSHWQSIASRSLQLA